MSYAKELARTEVAAGFGLVVAAAVLASVVSIQMAFGSAPVIGTQSAAALVFAYTLYIGFLPTALFGAPIYAALRRFKFKVTWPHAMCIGLVPGLLAAIYDLNLGIWVTAGGAIVAAITHGIREKSFNNSLKSRPPSASA